MACGSSNSLLLCRPPSACLGDVAEAVSQRARTSGSHVQARRGEPQTADAIGGATAREQLAACRDASRLDAIRPELVSLAQHVRQVRYRCCCMSRVSAHRVSCSAEEHSSHSHAST